MEPMAAHLRRAGFTVINLDYPSTQASIEALVETHLRPLVEAQSQAARLHFVTHSMGGILVRQLLSVARPAHLGRVVMIAPPNGGSELADRIAALPLLGRIGGPARRQLGTGPDSLPNRLPKADYPLGIIAGSRSFNPLYSWMIDGRDDGKVSVRRAQLDGMTDFITLPYTHTFIQQRAATARQVEHFLRHGVFRR